MKHWILICAVLSMPAGLRADMVRGTQVVERTQRALTAIHWEKDLEAAKERAAKEKKLVFWLQLVGELDGGL